MKFYIASKLENAELVSSEYFLHDERTCVFYWNNRVTRVVGDIKLLIEVLIPGEMEVAYG